MKLQSMQIRLQKITWPTNSRKMLTTVFYSMWEFLRPQGYPIGKYVYYQVNFKDSF